MRNWLDNVLIIDKNRFDQENNKINSLVILMDIVITFDSRNSYSFVKNRYSQSTILNLNYKTVEAILKSYV